MLTQLEVPVLYDERFLDAHVGKHLLTDPVGALVELIANAWDAGATLVEITWPDAEGGSLVIADNGTGMTDAEFQRRWRKLSYNRRVEQGEDVAFPADTSIENPRRIAFGRNGVGRWAAFCFSDRFFVDTSAQGNRNRYRVTRGSQDPFEIEREVSAQPTDSHGTELTVFSPVHVALSPGTIRAEIGMRFLTDPTFSVRINHDAVTFEDIDAPNIEKLRLEIGDGNVVELVVIDTHATDRTSQQHGVAWHVLGRLVGRCSWDGPRAQTILDRRSIAAKRFTFIVQADHLADCEAVKKDWSGFNDDDEAYQRTAEVVYDRVDSYLFSASEADRKVTLAKAESQNRAKLQKMTPLERERWLTFVTEAQENCPRVRETDIVKLSEIMAKLELSQSGYDLLHKLNEYGPEDLDELNSLLADWTLDMAKVVLDEIAKRLRLVEELEARTKDSRTREVQDLQPLFEQGLWIFGPEFETIEYTSNVGMTRVIQRLFGSGLEGSRNRPDFAVLPDSTAGLYACPRYDQEGGEVGTQQLVIIELKRPGVKLGEAEKTQCWKYVKELFSASLLQEGQTKVRCFVLGSEVDPFEGRDRQEADGTVVITPMLFETVLQRAKSRLLNLHRRVEDAPFLQSHRQEIQQFLGAVTGEPTLFDTPLA